MKLLIISHEYPPIGGGGANACFFLTKELAKMGHGVTVLTAGLGGRQDEEVTSDGVVIRKVKCRRKSEASSSFIEMLSFLLSAWKQAGRLVRENNYDFCIAFFGIPSGPLALYLKKRYKLPYMIRTGGGDIPGAQKRFAAVYKIIAPILRKVWKESVGIVANSKGLKKRAEGFESRYPIYVVENGVDSDFFHPDETKRDEHCINILFVSRLIEGKGLQFVIPRIMDIHGAVFEKTGRNICLTVVGDGPYRENLEKLAVEYKCSDIVRFLGKRDKEYMAEIYQMADLFILPSLSEGMPNVVLEAMASGLPIIMTSCEGSGELITDNGYIADIDGFADKIIDLCVNDKLRHKMGENSVYAVKKRFSWHRTAEAYVKLVREGVLRSV